MPHHEHAQTRLKSAFDILQKSPFRQNLRSNMVRPRSRPYLPLPATIACAHALAVLDTRPCRTGTDQVSGVSVHHGQIVTMDMVRG